MEWPTLLALVSFGGMVLGSLIYLALRTSLEKGISAKFDLYRERELESLRAELSMTLEGLKHQYQLEQARLSLAFEHQRAAYSEILAVLTEAKKGFDGRYDWEDRTYRPFKDNPWPRVYDARLKHLLFLDEEVLDALEFCMAAISSSLAWSDGNQEHEPSDDVVARSQRRFEFLLQKTARLLRAKAGLVKDEDAFLPIAAYGAIGLVNRAFYSGSGFPTTGFFREDQHVSIDGMVTAGLERRKELVAELERLIMALLKFREGGIFHDSLAQANRFRAELLREGSGDGSVGSVA